jgi:hypothetical protein
MAARDNALAELTRLWLHRRHHCATIESFPVPVPYGNSDIDFVASRLDGTEVVLRDGLVLRPSLMVEVKDEHDFDPDGKDFGKRARHDAELMGELVAIPRQTGGVCFSMLRQEHYEVGVGLFGKADFDRLFVVHSIRMSDHTREFFAKRRVFWISARELFSDLETWYSAHPRKATLRHTIAGDFYHLFRWQHPLPAK